MVMTTPNWLQFTGHQPKRKRAELACTLCHSKKIRCDLQVRTGQGHSNCTNCDSSGKECRMRPSKRSHRRVNRVEPPATSPEPIGNHSSQPPAAPPAPPPPPASAPASVPATAPPPPPPQSSAPLDSTIPAEAHPEAAASNNGGPPAPGTTTLAREPEWIWGFEDSTHQHQHQQQHHPHQETPPAPPTVSLPTGHNTAPVRSRSSIVAVEYHPAPPPSASQPPLQHTPDAPIPTESPATCRTEDTDVYRADTISSRYYQLEIQADARHQEQRELAERRPTTIRLLPSPDLQQSFVETYLDFCSAWCPVLDREQLAQDLAQSPLLVNALAVVGSHIQPPVMPHDGPAAYYERARTLFYNDEEPDVVRSLQAVALFYWWSPRPPSTLHRHSSWWWTSVIIRHCQQLGVHQQPSVPVPGAGSAFSQHNTPQDHRSLLLRRRIWWTAFARERLTAICQSKPCIIDPADCDIPEPSLADFPDFLHDRSSRTKAEIFIYWVRLCAIIGRIAKYLSRPVPAIEPMPHFFPTHLARELIAWVHSLPPHLQLPIHADRTTAFNRDVHQLHLPYLAVIIMLHLKRPYQPHPEAYPPAILAASCVARIFRDTLARGGTRFLMAITGWYCGMAFIALLQACRVDGLAAEANDDLDILALAVDQLRAMWPTANIFHHGFQRLRPSAAGASALLSLSAGDGDPNHVSSSSNTAAAAATSHTASNGATSNAAGVATATATTTAAGIQPPHHHDPGSTGGGGSSAPPPAPIELDGIDWMEYFPFVTAQTSGIAEKLLVPHTDDMFLDDVFPDTMLQFQDLFENYNAFDVNLFM